MPKLYRNALVLPVLAFVLGLGVAPMSQVAADAIDPCLPAGSSSQVMTESWTALSHGESVVFHCMADAGNSYRFDLAYDGADQLPGDAGSYIAIESYAINHANVGWADRQSEPNGNDRETVARTADVNETWMIKVTNTANQPAYDTSFSLSSTMLHGND